MNVYKIYENYNINSHQHLVEYIALSFGIKGLELDVLSLIYKNGPTNQVELGNILCQNKTNISRVIDKLETKKLVERQLNPDNKRERIIVFAPRTKAMVESYIKTVEVLNQEAIKDLTDEEVIIFQKVLDKMSYQINELIKGDKEKKL